MLFDFKKPNRTNLIGKQKDWEKLQEGVNTQILLYQINLLPTVRGFSSKHKCANNSKSQTVPPASTNRALSSTCCWAFCPQPALEHQFWESWHQVSQHSLVTGLIYLQLHCSNDILLQHMNILGQVSKNITKSKAQARHSGARLQTSSLEVEAAVVRVWAPPLLHSKFKASLHYTMRSCIKGKKPKRIKNKLKSLV